MKIVEPSQARSRIEDDGATLRVIIPTPRNWRQITYWTVYAFFWLLGNSLTYAIFIGAFLEDDLPFTGPPPVLMVVLAWTLFVTLYSMKIWLSLMIGKEIIMISPELLSIRHVGISSGRQKQYLATRIKDLRVGHKRFGPWSWSGFTAWLGIADDGIAFDYGAKTFYFGRGIDEAEAKPIVEKIITRFPRYTPSVAMDRFERPAVKPTKPKSRIQDVGTVLRIIIPYPREWLAIIFSSVFCFGWICMGVFMIQIVILSLFPSHYFEGVLFLLIFTLVWGVLLVFTFYQLLSELIKKEIIEVSEAALTVKHAVIGLGRPKQYLVKSIKDIRVGRMSSARCTWSSNNLDLQHPDDGIAFDYGARTFYFGLGFDDAEAKQVVEKIITRFLQYAPC